MTSSEDPSVRSTAPHVFEVALGRLRLNGTDTVPIGDTPYDAQADGKISIPFSVADSPKLNKQAG